VHTHAGDGYTTTRLCDADPDVSLESSGVVVVVVAVEGEEEVVEVVVQVGYVDGLARPQTSEPPNCESTAALLLSGRAGEGIATANGASETASSLNTQLDRAAFDRPTPSNVCLHASQLGYPSRQRHFGPFPPSVACHSLTPSRPEHCARARPPIRRPLFHSLPTASLCVDPRLQPCPPHE
jgi:hypothetical protein